MCISKLGYNQQWLNPFTHDGMQCPTRKGQKHIVWNVIKFTLKIEMILLYYEVWALDNSRNISTYNAYVYLYIHIYIYIYQPQDVNATTAAVVVVIASGVCVCLLSCNLDYMWNNGIRGFWMKPLKDYSHIHSNGSRRQHHKTENDRLRLFPFCFGQRQWLLWTIDIDTSKR